MSFYMVCKCACGFGVILPLFFISFSTFSVFFCFFLFFFVFFLFFCVFFSGLISIRINILWVQLPLDFSIDHLETMHIFSTWPEDVHVVLVLSCRYLFSTFCTFSTYFFF